MTLRHNGTRGATSAGREAGFLMPETSPHQPPAERQPAATRLIRIADIPFDVRRKAALKLIDQGSVPEDQLGRMFELVVDPVDASGLVAA